MTNPTISFEDFKKIEMSLGEILEAEKIPETDKLLKLKVSFGKKDEVDDIRQVVSGIATYFGEPTTLIGKKFMFVTNLEPRAIKGFESQAMILALSNTEGQFALLSPTVDIPAGVKAK